jgi:type IV secretion system protein VirB10
MMWGGNMKKNLRRILKHLILWVSAVALFTACAPAIFAQEPPPPPPPAQNPPPTEPQKPKEEPPADADRPKLKTRGAAGDYIVLDAGTQLPLVVHNTLTTRNAKPGDPVYLETLFPITKDHKIVIPAGSYVHGQVVEAKRPGKVKGRGELLIRLDTLILPNGYTASFTAVPRNAGTGGNEEVDKEGNIKGDTDKTNDAGTVVRTTLAGAGIGAAIGAAAGSVGRGAGIGSGAGAVAGLMAVLLSRGPDIEVPRGSTLDIELNRPLYLESGQINFTDPGRASTLAGPPNRQPVRTNRFPY